MRRLRLFAFAIVSCTALPLQAQRPTPSPKRPTTTKKPTATKPQARPDSTKKGAPPVRAAVVRRPAPPPNERTFALTAGAAQAGLGFGVGPALGGVFRYRNGSWPIALRGDAQFGHFSQTSVTSTSSPGGAASLSHFGVGGGIEFPLGTPRATAPYLVATAGVYRFDGSGAAGSQSSIANGVFTGTTDLVVGGGIGFRFLKSFFVEGRVLSSGDFTTFPITIGYTFIR